MFRGGAGVGNRKQPYFVTKFIHHLHPSQNRHLTREKILSLSLSLFIPFLSGGEVLQACWVTFARQVTL
jgi:hypothetical protein